MAEDKPIRVLIVPDSFKESLTAPEVARAIAAGVRRAVPDADTVEAPMADGGEGTVAALVAACGGSLTTCDVSGPLGEPVTARYGLIDKGQTAVIEIAEASGLHLVPLEKRDPLEASTYGTGQLMADALDRGVTRVIVGLGGSATNDGGAGMAQALGYRLLDANGDDLSPGGGSLAQLDHIDAANVHPDLAACTIDVACDVTNPLCGPNGASRIYGPQKGAISEAVEALDAGLAHFGQVLARDLGACVTDIPGAGAAGGLGAGLMAFAGGMLKPGFELIAAAARLREKLAGADLVITGEGRIDGQTIHGKAPYGVARLAAEQGIPVIALAGSLGPGHENLYHHGIGAMFSICPSPMSLDEAMAHAGELLENAAEAAVRAFAIGGKSFARGV